MDVAAVMDEIGDALAVIDGLRVFPYSADRVVPPAGIVGWPDSITYDATFGRGSDSMVLPVWLVVGKADARAARDTLAAYLDGSGPASVKAAIDGHSYTACDSATATGVPNGVEAVSIAGVEYLAAVFNVTVSGRGA